MNLSYNAGKGALSMDLSQDINRLLKNISTNIQKINQNTSQIENLVSQIGTSRDSENIRDRLLQEENYTNQLAKETSKQLKELNNYIQPGDRGNKLQKERLTNDLFKTLTKFQEIQKLSMQKQRESNERAKANIDTTSEYAISGSNRKVNNEQVQIQMENDVNLIQIQEREAVLRKLENDIVDVNSIFKDLAVMVHEQGEVIDSIESNVETARVTVHNATSSLQSAVKNQSSVRKKKVIFAGIMLLVFILIVLIITISLKPWTG